MGARPRRIASRTALSLGFSLIELIVVVCLVAIFVAVAGNRLRLYQEAAEKASVQWTVAAMQSGLQLQVAALLIKGDAKGILALQAANPVRFLEHPPAGYAGEFSQPVPSLSGGSWYFDRPRGELVYVPDLRAHLRVEGTTGESSDGGPLRFRTRIDYEPTGVRGAAGGFRAAGILPLASYAWFDDGQIGREVPDLSGNRR